MCSLLIVSKNKTLNLKDQILVKGIEVIINHEEGLGKARNSCVEASTKNPLIFKDDDVLINPETWGKLLNVQLGTVIMAKGDLHPITRVMAINRVDFHKIGGFDQKIKYNGEDLDFYWRALKKGYKIEIVDVTHIPHKTRNNIKRQWESAYTRVKHGKVTLNYLLQRGWLITVLRILSVFWFSIKKLLGIL